MSQEQIDSLVARLASDTEFAATLAAASSAQEALRIAAEHGFNVTLAELVTASSEHELSDADLEAVAGGTGMNSMYFC